MPIQILLGDELPVPDMRSGKTIERMGSERPFVMQILWSLGGTTVPHSSEVGQPWNSSAVLEQSTSYGNWQQPEAILNVRFAKTGLQVSF